MWELNSSPILWNTGAQPSRQFNHQEQLVVRCLAQGHFDRGSGDRTSEPLTEDVSAVFVTFVNLLSFTLLVKSEQIISTAGRNIFCGVLSTLTAESECWSGIKATSIPHQYTYTNVRIYQYKFDVYFRHCLWIKWLTLTQTSEKHLGKWPNQKGEGWKVLKHEHFPTVEKTKVIRAQGKGPIPSAGEAVLINEALMSCVRRILRNMAQPKWGLIGSLCQWMCSIFVCKIVKVSRDRRQQTHECSVLMCSKNPVQANGLCKDSHPLCLFYM